MSNSPTNQGDEPIQNSHSGDEPKPVGGFKTLSYDDSGAASAKVVPPGAPAEEGEPTYGDENHSLAALDGMSDEELLQLPGVGEATVKKVHAARRKRDKANG